MSSSIPFGPAVGELRRKIRMGQVRGAVELSEVSQGIQAANAVVGGGLGNEDVSNQRRNLLRTGFRKSASTGNLKNRMESYSEILQEQVLLAGNAAALDHEKTGESTSSSSPSKITSSSPTNKQAAAKSSRATKEKASSSGKLSDGKKETNQSLHSFPERRAWQLKFAKLRQWLEKNEFLRT